MRADLLALTADDLAALTNRGTVKRAQRELDEAEITGTVHESPAGDISVVWSDGPRCKLPAGATLVRGTCSCAAVALCRHLVRAVLQYQFQHQVKSAAVVVATDAPPPAPVPAGPWNPGDITDEQLKAVYDPRGQAFAHIKGLFNKGILAEVVRSSKPTVRFHQPAAVVRFMVPGDPRYTHCDCADPAPCKHVPLAVWAFRLLPPEQSFGVVNTGGRAPAIPAEVLTEVDALMGELVESGFSAATQPWADRLTRLEARLRAEGLTWPADTVGELIEQQQRYAGNDALFAPDRVVELVGELIVRRDAIGNDTGELPQQLIRGTGQETSGTLGKCRLIGLGCGVTVGRHEVELVAYLIDADTGGMAVISKEFPDPKPETKQEPKPFPDLARHTAKEGTFAAVGAGQLLTDGGRRTAAGRLTFSRVKASVQPQAFEWESLKPPVAVESFAEVVARLAALPPAALRPRRAAEDFHVMPVASVADAGFDVPSQTVLAKLTDQAGGVAYLRHPFTTRGRTGAERLLTTLNDQAAALKFVAGTVRRVPGGLLVSPVCCVFEKGGSRFAVQPWIDGPKDVAKGGMELAAADAVVSPIQEVFRQLHAESEDVFLVGLRRAGPDAVKRWRELHRRAESVGLTRLGERIGSVAEGLDLRAHVVRWDPAPTAGVVLDQCALARLARDVG